ncbi:MAG: DUF3306 domain-containing protein [Hyphomicrobiales bacterium]
MSRGGKSDDILSRWARRREAVAKEEEQAAAKAEADAAVQEPETEEEAMALLQEQDPELAEKIAEVDFDKLTFEDDFTIFMSHKVPDIIRRRALSKLWLSDPLLANLDGLNDYDEDFKASAELVKVIKSAWEPGRGYAREEEKPEEDVSAEDAEEVTAGADEAASVDEEAAETVAEPDEETGAETGGKSTA